MAKKASQKPKPSGPITLLKFSAKWCGPCQTFAPVVHRWLDKHPDIIFKDIDIDTPAGQKLAQKYEVEAVPTILLLASNRPLTSMTGSGNQRDLTAMLKAAQSVME